MAAIASTSSALAAMVAEVVTSADSDAGVPFAPTPRDLSDYLTAMRWFVALNPPEMWHRRREPLELNQSQRLLVWRAANGVGVHTHVKNCDQVAAMSCFPLLCPKVGINGKSFSRALDTRAIVHSASMMASATSGVWSLETKMSSNRLYNS